MIKNNLKRLFPKSCSYQFLPLHKGAVITRKEQGSATPLPTDSRGWQCIWLTVRTKQEDPTELLFILFWPSSLFSLNRASSEKAKYLQKRLKFKINQGKSNFVFEGNDRSSQLPQERESGYKNRTNSIALHFKNNQKLSSLSFPI